MERHSPPPIYGSKRSPTSDNYNAKKRHATIVIKDLVYEAKAKANTFFSRPRPKTWKFFKANWDSYHYKLKFDSTFDGDIW